MVLKARAGRGKLGGIQQTVCYYGKERYGIKQRIGRRFSGGCIKWCIVVYLQCVTAVCVKYLSGNGAGMEDW